MKHYTLIPTSSPAKARVLALGSFDGFHLGHRAVIDAAVALAKELKAEPAVFCFDVPPACCIPRSTVKILGDKNERKELFAARGIRSLFVAGFEELRGLDARDFITEILMKECGAIGVVCGFNFAFGKNRAGTPLLLRDYFKDRVIALDPIYHGELPVSSSRIRDAISGGDIALATSMLGRNYAIDCEVSEGRKDGRKLGFPTINQHPSDGRAIPSHGVYVTRTILNNGQAFESVTDVGLAPTLDQSGRVRLETHLLDTHIDFSPTNAKVEFLERIRGEYTFNGIDELKEQISRDVEYARNYFRNK